MQFLQLDPEFFLFRFAIGIRFQSLGSAFDFFPGLLGICNFILKLGMLFIGHLRNHTLKLDQIIRHIVSQSASAHQISQPGGIFGAGEYPRKRVVIGLWDGIKFMIMASSATYGQTKHGTGHHINLLIHIIHDESCFEALVHILDTQGKKTRCNLQAV